MSTARIRYMPTASPLRLPTGTDFDKARTGRQSGGRDCVREDDRIYSLHVLARLGAWEDAREFMRYEQELP